MTPKQQLEELDTSHLEKLLEDLEKLSRYGQHLQVTDAKRKTIVDHVKFLVAKALTEMVD